MSLLSPVGDKITINSIMPKTRRNRRRSRKQRGGDQYAELIRLIQKYQDAGRKNYKAADGRYNLAKQMIDKIKEAPNKFATEYPGPVEHVFRLLGSTLYGKEDAKYLHRMIEELAAQIAPQMPDRFQKQMPINWGFEAGPRNVPRNNNNNMPRAGAGGNPR